MIKLYILDTKMENYLYNTHYYHKVFDYLQHKPENIDYTQLYQYQKNMHMNNLDHSKQIGYNMLHQEVLLVLEHPVVL